MTWVKTPTARQIAPGLFYRGRLVLIAGVNQQALAHVGFVDGLQTSQMDIAESIALSGRYMDGHIQYALGGIFLSVRRIDFRIGVAIISQCLAHPIGSRQHIRRNSRRPG